MALSALYTLAISGIATALPLSSYQAPQQCTNGGQLHCCATTLTGAALPGQLATDLQCYGLTAAVDICIISNASSDSNTGCGGTSLCCQVSDLDPVMGLFCSKPPDDCSGTEGYGGCVESRTVETRTDRSGNCSKSDIDRARGDLGLLEPVDNLLKNLTGSGVADTLNDVTGLVGGTVDGVSDTLNDVTGLVGGTVDGVADTANDVTGLVGGTVGGVSDLLGGVVGGLGKALGLGA